MVTAFEIDSALRYVVERERADLHLKADSPHGHLQPYFVYALGGGGQWPRNTWQKIRFVMSFPPATIPAGQRLGLAISVERQDTNAEAIQILYEHHLYPSRLEVDTTTPLG